MKGRVTRNTAQKKKEFLENFKIKYWIGDACKLTEVNRETVRQWRMKDKEFAKEYDEILQGQIEMVEDALYGKAIEEGDTKAQIFWLTNKAPEKWRIRTHNQNTNQNTNHGENTVINVNIKGSHSKLLEDINGIES